MVGKDGSAAGFECLADGPGATAAGAQDGAGGAGCLGTAGGDWDAVVAIDGAAEMVPSNHHTLGVDGAATGGVSALGGDRVGGSASFGGLGQGEQSGEGEEGNGEKFFHGLGAWLHLQDEERRARCRIF